MRSFEDFIPGVAIECGTERVSEADIIAFAGEFDPQPFHLDASAGAQSLLGGLCASGWHTACVAMRLMCSGFLMSSTSMGSPGIEELKWLKPVRPGDSLSLAVIPLEARASRSRPDMGLVKFEIVMTNQHAERVLTMMNLIMFRRRTSAEVA